MSQYTEPRSANTSPTLSVDAICLPTFKDPVSLFIVFVVGMGEHDVRRFDVAVQHE